MNIEEIRQHRVEAERVIFEVLRDFKKKTGLSIVRCGVEYAILNKLGSEPERVTTGVTLEIEPI